MFYKHRTDLPAALQRTMPIMAQEMYREAYNETWEEYQQTYQEREALSVEELAHRLAWGKVKQHFVKDCSGRWRPKSES